MSNRDTLKHKEWTDEEAEELAQQYADIFPIPTREDLASAVAIGRDGRVKVPISIRIDQAALEHVKELPGRYQTRINDLLCAFAAGDLFEIPAEWKAYFEGRNAADEVRRIVTEHIRRENANARRTTLAAKPRNGAAPKPLRQARG